MDDSRREARSAEIQYVESSLRGWVSRLQVLIPLALISLAAAAPAETLTVTVDIPERYKRAASEKCQIDEGMRAMFIIRFTPALERYLHTGYRLLIDNKPVEQGNSVSNPKGSQIASNTFIWETENSSHEPDGVHEYQLELLDANTKIHDYVVGTPRSRKVTVCDNDEPPPPPPVVAFAAANSEVSEGAGTKDVAVTVDPAPQSEITLSYSVAGTAKAGSDYRLSDTVTVAPGVARVNIPITIIDDEIEDSGETVVLTLSGGADYTVGSLSRHILIITKRRPVAGGELRSSEFDGGRGSGVACHPDRPEAASGLWDHDRVRSWRQRSGGQRLHELVGVGDGAGGHEQGDSSGGDRRRQRGGEQRDGGADADRRHGLHGRESRRAHLDHHRQRHTAATAHHR
ncbi:MAG: hypothetical protein OXN24_05460 [Candidatus Dadabacteria bacterium]|nr:hypothetical protein [Candidatus Dadabacteria bacterium]